MLLTISLRVSSGFRILVSFSHLIHKAFPDNPSPPYSHFSGSLLYLFPVSLTLAHEQYLILPCKMCFINTSSFLRAHKLLKGKDHVWYWFSMSHSAQHNMKPTAGSEHIPVGLSWTLWTAPHCPRWFCFKNYQKADLATSPTHFTQIKS